MRRFLIALALALVLLIGTAVAAAASTPAGFRCGWHWRGPQIVATIDITSPYGWHWR
jgi:hypothetical protein